MMAAHVLIVVTMKTISGGDTCTFISSFCVVVHSLLYHSYTYVCAAADVYFVVFCYSSIFNQ